MTTSVNFLLDRSQSMSSHLKLALEGFNNYVDEMRPEESIRFTLVTFNDISMDKVFVRTPIKEVSRLSTETFIPKGNTPLIRSAILTIQAVDESLKAHPAERVVFIILTDGMENASGAEYTNDWLRKMVKEREEKGWQFVFLGAGIDAYDQAGQVAVSRAHTVSYNSASGQHVNSTFRSLGAKVRSFATSGSAATMDWSESDKLGAGDKYHKPEKKKEDPSKFSL